jgi:ferredoxin
VSNSIITVLPSGIELPNADTSCSLLEVLEFHRIFIDYQCREGYCGSCRTRLVSGFVDYTIHPIAFLNEGEILSCSCRANGNIVIEL